MEVPTEKRVKRWALSMEELMSDPTGKTFQFVLIQHCLHAVSESYKYPSSLDRFTRIYKLFKKGVQPRKYKILAGGQRSQA